MRFSINKKLFSFLFLSAFLFLRVANAHSYSHFSEDDSSHCELCEIITTSQELTPFVDQVPIDLENKSLVFAHTNEPASGYEIPLYCFVNPSAVHNKPPPTTHTSALV